MDILKIKNRIRERNDHINSQLLQSFANLKRKREKRKEKKEKEKIEIDNFIFFLIKVGEDHHFFFFLVAKGEDHPSSMWFLDNQVVQIS